MSESTSGLSVETDPELRGKRRRAVLSAWAGFAVDSYSIFIASSVLLPALVYFQGDMSPETKSVFAGMTLAVTLLGRPLGGLIFGHFADRIGRRRIGAITIYGFGTISLLIACLPGAELVDVAALLIVRMLGCFIDGQHRCYAGVELFEVRAPFVSGSGSEGRRNTLLLQRPNERIGSLVADVVRQPKSLEQSVVELCFD